MLARVDEITAFAARLERYPTLAGQASVVRPVDLGGDVIGRNGWDFRYDATAGQTGSTHQYTFKMFDVGQTGSGASQTNGLSSFRFRGRFRMYEIGGALATLSASNRRRELVFTNTSGTGVGNLSLQSGPQWRSSITGATTKTAAVAEPRGLGLTFAAAVAAAVVQDIEIVYVAATGAGTGSFLVYIGGVLQAGLSYDPSVGTGHSNTGVVNRVTIGSDEVGTLAGTIGTWWEIGALTDEMDDPLSFSIDDGLPRGLVQLLAAEDGSQIFRVHAPIGMFGWTAMYARVLWYPGPAIAWPGDGAANTTAAAELPASTLYTGFLEATGLPAKALVTYKVVLQDDPTTPTREWVSEFYSIPVTAISDGDGMTDIRMASIWCTQQDGFSRTFDAFDVADERVQAGEFGVLNCPEDHCLYSDSRDIDTSVASDIYPYDRYLPPQQTSAAAMPSGSPIGMMLTFREGLCDPYASRTMSRRPMQEGGGDHLRDNSWATNWIGSGTNAPAPWFAHGVGISRGEVSSRAQSFIDNILNPGMKNTPSGTVMYRTAQYGRSLVRVYIDPISFRTSGSMLGATQLAWLLNYLSTTSVPYVMITTMGGPFFDVLWKSGQDWQDDSDWRDERDTIMAAIDANSAIRGWVAEFADLHGGFLSYRGRTGASDYAGYTSPKLFAEFGVGAGSNNLVANTLLKSTAAPDAPGTPITDFAPVEALDGVVWLSMQGLSPASPPPYTRQYGEALFRPTRRDFVLSAIDARRLNPPVDRVLESTVVSLDIEPPAMDLRGRGRNFRSRQIAPFY